MSYGRPSTSVRSNAYNCDHWHIDQANTHEKVAEGISTYSEILISAHDTTGILPALVFESVLSEETPMVMTRDSKQSANSLRNSIFRGSGCRVLRITSCLLTITYLLETKSGQEKRRSSTGIPSTTIDKMLMQCIICSPAIAAMRRRDKIDALLRSPNRFVPLIEHPLHPVSRSWKLPGIILTLSSMQTEVTAIAV